VAPTPETSQQQSDEADNVRQGTVLAFVQDVETEALLTECFKELRLGTMQVLRGSGEFAVSYLSKHEFPSYLIIDVGGESDALGMLRTITELLPPDVTIMVLGDRTDADFYRSVTHVFGAAEYLYRPFSRNLILRILGPIILHGRDTLRLMDGASLVACIGVRDGVGATTLTTNLAYFLAEEARRYSLLIDYDLRAGKMATLLDITTNGGFRSALEAPDRMDELLLERSMQAVGERLQVLSSTGDLNTLPKIGSNAVTRLMELVRPRFRFVLTEVKWSDDDVYTRVLGQAQQYILVMDPTIISVRDALRVKASLPRVSSVSKPFIVVNNIGRPGSLSLDEITQSLGTAPDILIPYLPAACGNAEIDGKLVITKNKEYRQAVEKLAHGALAVTLGSSLSKGRFFKKLKNNIEAFGARFKK
jgi:pilus assembly protein CpaE